MTVANISHIGIDEKGRAYIQGTRSRVSMIVCDTINGLSPADIHREYPHLSLAQVHAALSYYYDHKAEVDAEIERELAYSEAMRQEAIASGRQVTKPDKAEVMRRLRESRPQP